MRIGIYGGTFNPIHKTHIEIAEAALKQFDLDQVYFLIAGNPPHKDSAETISDMCRLDMLKLALSGQDRLLIDDREIYRSGKSYSYITFSELSLEREDDELFFIMGSDSLINFKNWVKPEIISSKATVLGAPRLGDDTEKINQAIFENKRLFEGDFFLIDYKANSLSSSYIRDNFYTDPSVKELLPDRVYDYILDHNLYSKRFYSPDTIKSLEEEMRKELSSSRFKHTIGVANTAYMLASAWNYPAVAAMVAGLLHDSAKCITDEKRLSICKKNKIEIRDIEYKYPHLLHGKVGAYFAKNKYEIDDEQICHAITVHTTGCPDMSLLDKIIFVADYIEPGRNKQPRLDVLRYEAFHDLDNCVFMILEDTIEYLNQNQDIFDPMTLDTYEYYVSFLEKRNSKNIKR